MCEEDRLIVAEALHLLRAVLAARADVATGDGDGKERDETQRKAARVDAMLRGVRLMRRAPDPPQVTRHDLLPPGVPVPEVPACCRPAAPEAVCCSNCGADVTRIFDPHTKRYGGCPRCRGFDTTVVKTTEGAP